MAEGVVGPVSGLAGIELFTLDSDLETLEFTHEEPIAADRLGGTDEAQFLCEAVSGNGCFLADLL